VILLEEALVTCRGFSVTSAVAQKARLEKFAEFKEILPRL
jgi:hypothetical protein